MLLDSTQRDHRPDLATQGDMIDSYAERLGRVKCCGYCRLSAALIVIVSGCHDPEPISRSNVSVNDSAEVTIVRNAALVAPIEARSSLILAIGDADGHESQFSNIVQVALLTGDRVAVADGPLNEVRVYDLRGRLQRRWGGAGDGPGEFRGLTALFADHNGRIYVWDADHLRVTVLDVSTGGIRTFSILDKSDYPLRTRFMPKQQQVLGVLEAGSILYSSIPRVIDGGGEFNILETALMLADSGGAPQRRLGLFPISETALLPDGGTIAPHFRAQASLIAAGGEIYYAFGRQPVVSVHDRFGRLRKSIRWDEAPRPVTRQAVQLYRRWLLSRIAGAPSIAKQSLARRFDEVPSASSLPFIRRLIVDDQRALWVESYPDPEVYYQAAPHDYAEVWHVFDSSGTSRATVILPAGFRLMHVAAGRLAGVSTDSFGTQQLQVRALNDRL